MDAPLHGPGSSGVLSASIIFDSEPWIKPSLSERPLPGHRRSCSWGGKAAFIGTCVRGRSRFRSNAAVLSSACADACQSLICNDLCQALNWAKAKTNFIQFPGSIRMGLRYQIPALATLIYVDSGFLPTYRSMVRRERHRLKAWITVACANIVFSWIARTLKRP